MWNLILFRKLILSSLHGASKLPGELRCSYGYGVAVAEALASLTTHLASWVQILTRTLEIFLQVSHSWSYENFIYLRPLDNFSSGHWGSEVHSASYPIHLGSTLPEFVPPMVENRWGPFTMRRSRLPLFYLFLSRLMCITVNKYNAEAIEIVQHFLVEIASDWHIWNLLMKQKSIMISEISCSNMKITLAKKY